MIYFPVTPEKKTRDLRWHDLVHNQPKSAYLCRGHIFSNTQHFRCTNCRFLCKIFEACM